MSYAFPTRSTRNQAVGPAARRHQQQDRNVNDGVNGPPVAPAVNRTELGAGRQDERAPVNCSAYTMIPPKEEKRQQITRRAEMERQAYEAYKKQNKPGRVSYVGTVGSGLVTGSEQDARARAQQEQRTAKFNSRQKAEQYRQKKKMMEDKEIQKKKDLQRLKSEQKNMRDHERQQKLSEDHWRKNQQFLDRLEGKSGW